MTTIPTLPILISVKETATHLGVSEKTVRRWIENGDLHIHRIGRLVRISEADLVVFIKSRRN
jgi:excisionase family DNA binding protein